MVDQSDLAKAFSGIVSDGEVLDKDRIYQVILESMKREGYLKQSK